MSAMVMLPMAGGASGLRVMPVQTSAFVPLVYPADAWLVAPTDRYDGAGYWVRLGCGGRPFVTRIESAYRADPDLLRVSAGDGCDWHDAHRLEVEADLIGAVVGVVRVLRPTPMGPVS